MKKGNRIRFFVWGIVMILMLSSSLYGLVLYYEGYGKTGMIREKLYPIVDAFNNLDKLKTYRNADIRINADLEDDHIIVTYNTVKNKNSYKFDYVNMDGEHIIKSKFNQADETAANVIITSMIDAASIVSGFSEGDVYNDFKLDDFYRTDVKDGVQLIMDNSSIEVLINVDKSPINYVDIEDLTKDYLVDNDISGLRNTFLDNSIYTYTKGNTVLFVQDDGDKYVIYIQNGTYNSDLYKSILTVINNLDLDTVIKDEFEISYPLLSTSKSFGNYKVSLDADGSLIQEFNSKEKIVKIEIKKI